MDVFRWIKHYNGKFTKKKRYVREGRAFQPVPREDPGRTSSTRPGIRLLPVHPLNGWSYGLRDVTCLFCTWRDKKCPGTRSHRGVITLRGRYYCVRAKYAWDAQRVTGRLKRVAITPSRRLYTSTFTHVPTVAPGRMAEMSKFYKKKYSVHNVVGQIYTS